MGTRTWNKDRATKRIDMKIDGLPLKDIEIKEYVRDTDLGNLPRHIAYRVNGAHLYADILNLNEMLHVTDVEGETCHRRTLRFLNMHYRAVHRILQRVDALFVDFHNQRLHSVMIKPYDSEKSRVHKAVAVGQLIIDVLAQTGEDADHPAANEFINAKSRIGDLSQFNLSVLVSREILEREDELIRAICESIVDNGEPGVLFIDNIAASDNLRTIEEIVGTNSCCEQPLPAFGSSPLGSVNIARFVENPFTLEARIDFDRLDAVVCTAIRMLDNIIELERYPTERQASVARSTRRVGLGIMGLDDALRMLGTAYGSEDSLDTVAALLRRVRAASYAASIELAAERGAFPRFAESRFTTGPGWLGVKDSGSCGLFFRRGIRNGALTAIAPAGSLALLAGNVSAGIEPTYSYEQERTIRIEGVPRTFRLQPYWAGLAPSESERHASGGYATGISASAHVCVVGRAQQYVDGGISKTVNLAEHATARDVRAAIHLGHALGVKGLSFYREHCRRPPVLV